MCRRAYQERKTCQLCVTDFNVIGDGKSDMIFAIDESEDVKLVKGDHMKIGELKHILSKGVWLCRVGDEIRDCVEAGIIISPFLMAMPPIADSFQGGCQLTNAMDLFYYCPDKNLCIRKEWACKCKYT